MEKNLNIYKASAGSGKTYNLTLRYLEILFSRPEAYRSILAVTFTNKAASEMKERILTRLYLLSVADPGTNDYRDYLVGKGLASDHLDVRLKAKNALSIILNDYSAFYIQTIDKFFQWVVRGFTREIGLQNSYNLELNTSSILSEAIDLLMTGMEEDRDLRNWLVEFAEDNLLQGRSWNFQNEILKLGKEVFRESYQELLEYMPDGKGRSERIIKLRNELAAEIGKFENKLTDYADSAFRMMDQKAFSIEDFSSGKSGVLSIFLKIRNGNFDLDPMKNPRAGVDNVDKWRRKADLNDTRFEELYQAGFNQLLKDSISFWDEGKTKYFTARALKKNIYSFGILNRISEKIEEITGERNIFLLPDTAVFLKRIIGDNEAPFIYEKAGNYFRHFMLDEFQDTSRFQWHNFRPLILNSIAENNRNIIVGDVKQAIYRWRNSDWKILAGELEKEFHPSVTGHTSLDTNYRSLVNVISFNNSFFLESKEIIHEMIEDGMPETANQAFRDEWLKLVDMVYGEAGQKIPLPGGDRSGGYITHRFIPDMNKEEKLNFLSEEIPALVRSLQDRGFRAADITFLVRYGREGSELAEILMEAGKDNDRRYNFNVISNDSLYVSNHHSVRFLLSLFRYFNHRGDSINLSILKYEYFRFISLSPAETHSIFLNADKDDRLLKADPLFRNFLGTEKKLMALPVFELGEELIRIFRLNDETTAIPYIQAFQDIVLEFTRKEKGDLSSFLQYWERNSSQFTLTVSEEQDAIRIMTIHKAKGLQFRVVILPFCDWSIGSETTGNKASILWASSANSGFDGFPWFPVLNSSRLKETSFSLEYYEELYRSYVDNLNLLYVAFTRAEEELHAFSGIKAGFSRPANAGELAFQIYSRGDSTVEDYPSLKLESFLDSQNLFFRFGDEAKPKEKGALKATGKTVLFDTYPVSQKTEKLSLNHKNIYLSDLKEAVHMHTGYGTQMHEIFSSILSIDDCSEALRKAWLKGLISSEESAALEAEIKRKLSATPFKEWFSDLYTVKNEAEIINGPVGISRPDRVMIGENHVIVLDYKFGKEKYDKYEDQVRDYSSIIRNLGYADVRAYLWYYNLDELKEVKG